MCHMKDISFVILPFVFQRFEIKSGFPSSSSLLTLYITVGCIHVHVCIVLYCIYYYFLLCIYLKYIYELSIELHEN